MKHNSLLLLSAIAFVSQSAIAQTETFEPPQYICYRTPQKITVDGIISPKEWDSAPWTRDFIDIEGESHPTPYFQTRAKMLWDDEGIYFAAKLDETNVCATLKHHDDVIYHDNDFEIFIDPTGMTHHYLEYEMNAFGTDWDLMLTAPYRDGAFMLNNWEIIGKKSAVHVEGTVNNAKDKDKYWSIEVFFPWSAILQVMPDKSKIENGLQLRVNFSRVEYPEGKTTGENNWVWAATKEINIHRPEFWGFVQLSDKKAGAGTDSFVLRPAEKTKWTLRNLYYRQTNYKKQSGHYAETLEQLHPETLCNQEDIAKIRLYTTPDLYEITMPSPDGHIWTIYQNGLIK